jgi:deazaflavin-dependent oxidoreductase (nitroreductase family)
VLSTRTGYDGLSYMTTGATPNTNWNDWNAGVVDEFRANQGSILSGRFAGRRLLLLTTVGARSGLERTTPLAFTRAGDHYVVIASKAGSPSNPDWYHNLVRNPVVTVETGQDTFRARARIAKGDERERLFQAQAERMPNFAEYQRRTTRQIPVIVLERLN